MPVLHICAVVFDYSYSSPPPPPPSVALCYLPTLPVPGTLPGSPTLPPSAFTPCGFHFSLPPLSSNCGVLGHSGSEHPGQPHPLFSYPLYLSHSHLHATVTEESRGEHHMLQAADHHQGLPLLSVSGTPPRPVNIAALN